MTYRGRAIPIAWKLLKHNSSAVGVKEIHPVLSSAYAFLCHLPEVEQVYFRRRLGLGKVVGEDGQDNTEAE